MSVKVVRGRRGGEKEGCGKGGRRDDE